MNMYQVVDSESGLVYAEFSKHNQAYTLWGTLRGARVQLVQRPSGTPDSCRSASEPPEQKACGDHIEARLERPSQVPFVRRRQWRDWVARSC